MHYLASLSTTVDGIGIYGNVLHYSMLIAFTSSAALLFWYFWYNKRLDMDEDPKFLMLQQNDDKPEESHE